MVSHGTVFSIYPLTARIDSFPCIPFSSKVLFQNKLSVILEYAGSDIKC